MTPHTRTLLLIAGFVVFSLGSFIWFIATWDPSKEEPVVSTPTTPIHIALAPQGDTYDS